MNTANIKIVTLSASCWRATRLHKSETTKVNTANHTDAARVSVRICDHAALTTLRQLHASVYQKHIALTRPSIQDGMRIIPLAHELEHMEMIRTAREEHDKLVAQFLADYDSERDAAPYKLNGLYDASMWPDHRTLERKFAITVHYLGCPNDPAWQDWIAESCKAATDNLCDEIEQTISHIAERCETVDGRLHASLFTSLQNLLLQVPHYDTGLSSKLLILADEARSVANSDVASLRDVPSMRQETAQKARGILSSFGGMS